MPMPKPPTQDPDCPPFGKRAKLIMNRIRERAETDILDDPEALANHKLPAPAMGIMVLPLSS